MVWKFIPTKFSHFSFHFRALGVNNKFMFKELYTFLNEIETIANFRPLFPSSSDSNNLYAFIPVYLLIGRLLTIVLEEKYLKVAKNQLKIFQRMQKLIQLFWNRDKLELLLLQKKVKQKSRNQRQLTEGDFVLFKNMALYIVRHFIAILTIIGFSITKLFRLDAGCETDNMSIKGIAPLKLLSPCHKNFLNSILANCNLVEWG